MDFRLDETQLRLQQKVRDFCEKEIVPRIDADELGHKFQHDILLKMAAQGFFGCPFPKEYGGNGLGFVAHAIVCEEFGRYSGSLRGAINMQTMTCAMPIMNFGTEDMKKKYVPGLISGKLLGCIAITETEAGADAAAMSTTAVLDGDHYVMNGSKNWITHGAVADLGVIFAYTDRSQRHKGMSCFLVDMHSPGLKTKDIGGKLGLNSMPTSELFFENVRIPKENLLGKPGQGFPILMHDLNNTRLSTAAGGLGAAQAALEATIKYAQEHKSNGVEMSKLQSVQDIIARMTAEVHAARLLVYRCASQKDQGNTQNTLETSMAKYYAGEAASRLSDMAFQVIGLDGYASGSPIERCWRENKLFQIAEGSANIQKVIISANVLAQRG